MDCPFADSTQRPGDLRHRQEFFHFRNLDCEFAALQVHIRLNKRKSGSIFIPMPMQQSHGTDSARRTYSGQEVSGLLLQWINDPSKDRPRQKVRNILEAINYLRTGYDGPPFLRARYKRNDHARAIRHLEALLQQYRYYPMFVPFGSFSRHWFPVPKGNKRFGRWPVEYGDVSAVFNLAQLAEMGLLVRIRKCICGKWLFARFSHQRFCGAQCREKEFRSSPEWKEYRRKKAREYYRLHKSGKVK
jgi:hypothetical protein